MDEIKVCRHCKKQYRKTKAVAKKRWQGCCSRPCFLSADPLPIVSAPKPLVAFLEIPTVSVNNKKRRKNDRRHRYQIDPFYKSGRWNDLRYKVLSYYGRECMLCGQTSGQLHVDHIIPKSCRPDLAFDFDNLQVLCKNCNLGKSNKDSKDYRPKVRPGMPKSVSVHVSYGEATPVPNIVILTDKLLVKS